MNNQIKEVSTCAYLLLHPMELPGDDTIINTLKRYNAYVTKNRIAILKILIQSGTSISVARIRKLSPVNLDRISVYRTLQFLLKKGVIRIVPNSRGVPQYILNDSSRLVSRSRATGQPAYFICKDCGHTELVEQDSPLEFKKPDHHHVSDFYMVLEGLCDKCKRQDA